MDILEVILLIVGIVIFIGSFLLPAGRSDAGRIDTDAAKQEIHGLIEEEMKTVRAQVQDKVEETSEDVVEKAERSLERLTNEKIMAVNEYSDTVLQEIHKNHEEAMFLYDMLNNKHANIKDTVSKVDKAVKAVKDKMFSIMIPVDKIKDVIGKGGKVIQEMCANFNCKIDIEEDGHVFISAVDQDDAKRAIATIKTIVEDPEIGAIYKGRVTRLMNFGAFVEIAPGKEGLVHISKLDDHRVEHVEDVVAVGDPIFVMVTDIDQQGRINLSRKDAIAAIAKKRAEAAQQ